MANEKTNPEPPQGGQKTLKLSDYQMLTVALAQRIHNENMSTGQALVQQGEAKKNEAITVLKAAVEGAFREQKAEIPTAEIKIVNNERGQPAVFVWTDAPKQAEEAPEGGEADEAAHEAESSEEEAPAAERKPAPSAPANGKHPEAAKRKLPVK